ncbi:dihydroorotate dehydrogenase (quinone) [Synchytrium endobioticum]|uniref:Dihydroorotate dehydrogenase (quinone), mitochondrial n=1 Tax=Synchytrium endobioticum TaxID=286115 RepID=A0A507CIG1_9FUNG|nr:dihydroorotate dehydrogenase (quinone) [Synchytrium endobioticum]
MTSSGQSSPTDYNNQRMQSLFYRTSIRSLRRARPSSNTCSQHHASSSLRGAPSGRRFQSTYRAFEPTISSIAAPIRYAAYLLAGTLFISYTLDPRAHIHQHIFIPLIHWALPDAEDSHKLAIWLAQHGLSPRDSKPDSLTLATELFSRKHSSSSPGGNRREFVISNPIGLAAGFDKNGEAIDGLLNMGFGMVEIGSVTPLPQNGNARPRMFRLSSDQAVINRYGFNSDGIYAVLDRLRARFRAYHTSLLQINDYSSNKSLRPNKLLGINLGKNKTSPPDSTQDYIDGVHKLGPYADYLVVNVSSPNTPGLRSLQKREMLEKLLNDVKQARDEALGVVNGPPILVKIAPDLTDEEAVDVAECIRKVGIDGVIISNTTTSRPPTLKSPSNLVNEQGGLSGAPLKPLSLSLVSRMYKLLPKDIPIIGCGGVSSAEDVLEYGRAGASAVQLYTALGYEGAGLVARIKDDLVKALDGTKWTDIVGVGVSTQ